jgi:hypothetical protein
MIGLEPVISDHVNRYGARQTSQKIPRPTKIRCKNEFLAIDYWIGMQNVTKQGRMAIDRLTMLDAKLAEQIALANETFEANFNLP